MNDYDILLDNLKRIMRERHLTKEQFAVKIGVTGQTVRNMFKAKYPKLETILEISKVFNITMQDLFTPNNGIVLKTEDQKEDLIKKLNEDLTRTKNEVETYKRKSQSDNETIERLEAKLERFHETPVPTEGLPEYITYRGNGKEGVLKYKSMELPCEVVELDFINMVVAATVNVEEITLRK